MRRRFEQSAVRLLKNIFRPGLFENPYLNVVQSTATVGRPEFMTAGYTAQLKSVAMLKNSDNVLPLQANKTVYIPKKFTPAGRNFLGMPIPESLDYPVKIEMVKRYFNVTDDPDEADYALAFIGSPNSGLGYDKGYVPISLQFGEYKATGARDPSMAGGDPLENFTNRTYKNKKVKAINITDLAMVNDTHKKMKGKPVIVIMNMTNPAVFSEFEPNANGILVHFGVQHQALFDILTGVSEPTALLPLQMPADMQTVEAQAEDVPHDMKCYVDKDGNKYDFAFGLNWNGVINDSRTERYKKK
jgi:beta-glucosidase